MADLLSKPLDLLQRVVAAFRLRRSVRTEQSARDVLVHNELVAVTMVNTARNQHTSDSIAARKVCNTPFPVCIPLVVSPLCGNEHANESKSDHLQHFR